MLKLNFGFGLRCLNFNHKHITVFLISCSIILSMFTSSRRDFSFSLIRLFIMNVACESGRDYKTKSISKSLSIIKLKDVNLSI